MANIFLMSFFVFFVVLYQTSATPLDSNNTCSQPLRIGSCFAKFPSFGYDTQQKKCVQFTYGGCDGNSNRFEKLEDCKATCEACSQPIEPGYCFASETKFAFHPEQKKCIKFTYGGCAGNKNNFETLEACEAECA